MSTASQHRRRAAWASLRRPVVAVGLGLVALQTGFRAWALYPSWFYTDDYRLLYDASGTDLTLAYLARPFDSQFMPIGRLIAWLVAESGPVNWALAASVTLILQLLASLACLWMLVTLFGSRWGILAPLGLYLSSAIVMPALMWWAASLNQLPWQLVFFLAVGAWTTYLRHGQLRWLGISVLVLAIGLLAYVKTMLVFGVLIYLTLAHFSSGGLVRRTRSAIAQYWKGAAAALLLGVGFVAYYTTNVPQIFTGKSADPVAGDLASSMLGTSLASGAVGGPWAWSTVNPPTGYADPPMWTVHAAWVLLTVFALSVFLTRERTGRAFGLVAGYAAVAYLLVLTSRAQVAGAAIGTEYRYLTDVAAVLVLALGLVTMPVVKAVESSAPREEPLLLVRFPIRVSILLTVFVCGSGLVSSAAYARIWHTNNPGADYVSAIQDSTATRDRVDVADQIVPDAVIPGFSNPYNTTRRLLPLVSDKFRFPESSPDLAVLDASGEVRRALIETGTTNTETPDDGCGWQVLGGGSTDVPLRTSLFQWPWWLRIGYLASADSTVTVSAGGTEVEAEVNAGLNSLYVQLEGTYDAVTVSDLAPGTRMCIDAVEVGNPVPGGGL